MLVDGIEAWTPTSSLIVEFDCLWLITSHGHGGPGTLSILGHLVMTSLRAEVGGARVAVNSCGGGEEGEDRYCVGTSVNK